MKDLYYIISEVDNRQKKSTNSSDWPKLIAYSFKNNKVLLLEGCGHGLMGGTIAVDDPKLDNWGEFFEATNTKWFYEKIKIGKINKLDSEEKFFSFLDDNKISREVIEY